MTLADEYLKQLDGPPVTAGERALARCRHAADFVFKGQFDAAGEALGDLWRGVGQRPETGQMEAMTEAEVLLQCGTLTGWLGSTRQISGAQERAKDLLYEALETFRSQGMAAKVSEAQYELGICYWRLGAFDEARLMMTEAMKPLADADVELKAKILIRRTLVDISENKYYEALDLLKEAEPLFGLAGDALKGRWHGQKGLIFRRLGTAERRAEYFDSAIMEYTAAIFHYEQAKHERYCGTNLNNLAFLLYKLGRYRDAHEQLDRAQLILTKLKDPGNLAQVDETRARVLVAERKYREADRVMAGVIKTLEQSGEAALLADALTLQGMIWAGLGRGEGSVGILRHAIRVAREAGANTQAGMAALTLIEAHGESPRLSAAEAAEVYSCADELLRETQDAEDIARLRACAGVVVKRLSGMQLEDKGFSFYGAVHELEARLIEQALELEAGSVSRAARRLGLKHQSLSHMLTARHRKLMFKRTPPEKRRRSIIKKDC
ncbi:MAG TPA: helix-turn-helix domain-containing protein [Pyrinomonadaceae bacterium]|jgi:tetratricopeptide (TPR) repeat protein